MDITAPLTKENAIKNDRSTQLSKRDSAFIAASIRLGKSRIGRTAPNPSVGALIVRYENQGARVVGRGVTGLGGRPHGEVVAIRQAGEAASGATCYVSLEPCAHHGRTPPCVEALLNAGVSRVVVAMQDPDPRVSGRGSSFLREASVEVYENAERSGARRANIGHVTRVEKGRPAITLKLAISKDGMIGKPGIGNYPVTGELSKRVVHGMRARADAILVGVDTLLTDDPDLRCRLDGLEDWSPDRVILDTNARTPLDAAVLKSANLVPVRLFVGEDALEDKVVGLEERGAEVIRAPVEQGRISLAFVVQHLAEYGCTNLLVEGGATIATSFLNADLVDVAALFESSQTIGCDGLPALCGDQSIQQILQDRNFEIIENATYESDHLVIWGRS